MGDQQAAQQYDLAALAPSSDTTEFEVLDPVSRKGIGLFVEVYGKDSDVYKTITRRQTNKRLRSLGKGGFRGAQITAEENEAEALEILAGCTKSWRLETRDADGKVVSTTDKLQYSGEVYEYSTANARFLYTRIPTLYEQVDDAIHDRQGFLKR